MTAPVGLEPTPASSGASAESAPGLRSGIGGGLGLVPRAWRLLRAQRSLWIPAIIPALVTTLAVSGAVAIAFANAGEWLHWVQLELPWPSAGAWYTWLWVGPARAALWLLARLWVGIVSAACVGAALLLSALVASPVLDVLSQRVERVIRGFAAGDDDALAAGTLLRDAGAALVNEGKRLLFFGSAWLVITLAGLLLPLGPLLAPAALVVFAIAFLPLEYAGFALDRRRVGFSDRRNWLKAHRATALGFGAIAFAMTWVPGLNFVMLPLLVTAGTLLVLERPPEVGGEARP